MEELPPFTSNTFELEFYKKGFLDHYRASRQVSIERPLVQMTEGAARNRAGIVSEVLSGLAKLGMRVREGDLSRLNPPDRMDIAMPIMADVRAYFQGKKSLFCIFRFLNPPPSGLSTLCR